MRGGARFNGGRAFEVDQVGIRSREISTPPVTFQERNLDMYFAEMPWEILVEIFADNGGA